eukprot:217803_1
MCCCFIRDKRPKRGHVRRQTTMHDILLSVGFQYAFCRQFIFLTNALLIGCSMALIAAGVQQSDTNIGIWMGSSWYQMVMILGGSAMLTTLLGCTGACYEARAALILYIIVLVLLILGEASIIFVATSSELDQLMEDNWNKLDTEVQQEIAEQFNCDATDAASCIDAARGEAQSAQKLILYVCGGTIVYQLVMLAFTAFYLKGLKQKKSRIKDIKQDKESRRDLASPASDGMEEIAARDYKNIRHA